MGSVKYIYHNCLYNTKEVKISIDKANVQLPKPIKQALAA